MGRALLGTLLMGSFKEEGERTQVTFKGNGILGAMQVQTCFRPDMATGLQPDSTVALLTCMLGTAVPNVVCKNAFSDCYGASICVLHTMECSEEHMDIMQYLQ